MLPAATWVRPPAKGKLHKYRRALQLATSLVFIVAPFVNLLRFDLKGGALILGGASFGLADLQAVFLLILLFIVVVFAGALIYGRIYCGWMCPQTTLSELVATLERWGSKRVKSAALKKVIPYVAIFAISAFVAASLVSYFLDPSQLLHPPRLAVVSWGISTAVLALFLFLRHSFCAGFCPYGLLQNIIQDGRTLGVAFDAKRRNECTDCLLCVRACFIGVDIRHQSFDTRCLNCGDCIAATTIAKRCAKEPLITYRYGTEASTWPGLLRKLGILDARRAIIVVLTIGLTIVTILQLARRRDFEGDVAAQYERTSTDAAGGVHNVYRLSLHNRLRHPVRVHVDMSGLPGLAIDPAAGLVVDGPAAGVVQLAPGEEALRDVVFSVPCGATSSGVHDVTVQIAPEGQKPLPPLPSIFFVPNRSKPCAGSSDSPSPRSSESSSQLGSSPSGRTPSSSTSIQRLST